MVPGEILCKTYESIWTLKYLQREQEAKQIKENISLARKNIQKTMAEYTMLARQRNRSVELN